MEPGIYDNRATMRREVWEHLGGIVGSGPIVLVKSKDLHEFYRAQVSRRSVTFPDLPEH